MSKVVKKKEWFSQKSWEQGIYRKIAKREKVTAQSPTKIHCLKLREFRTALPPQVSRRIRRTNRKKHEQVMDVGQGVERKWGGGKGRGALSWVSPYKKRAELKKKLTRRQLEWETSPVTGKKEIRANGRE